VQLDSKAFFTDPPKGRLAVSPCSPTVCNLDLSTPK